MPHHHHPDRNPPGMTHHPARRGTPLTTERTAYFALVNQGIGSREAARRVGINYRTAKHWRAAAHAALAPPPAPVTISSRYLSLPERILIADRIHQPHRSVRSIARELGRPVSTITRELGRNQQPDGTYQPHQAHEQAAARRARPKISKLTADPARHAVIQDRLRQRHSPQQIARRLRRDHPDRPEWHVTHETVYQALYVQAKGQLRREVASWLRTGRIQRRPRTRPDQRRPRMATAMIMISDRPAEATDRAVPGHGEGDLIMGAFNRSAIGTLVDRASRFVMLLHLPDGHTPDKVRDALVTGIRTLPEQVRRSLTWDQGSEMHLHHQITIATDLPIYFCDPHSPWQHGSKREHEWVAASVLPEGH